MTNELAFQFILLIIDWKNDILHMEIYNYFCTWLYNNS